MMLTFHDYSHSMIKKLPYFLILVLALFLISLPLLIKVTIECRSQFGDCPSEINSKLKTLNSNNLSVAKKKAADYLGKNFLVSEFSIQFKLPNVMLVNIIAKKPYFALKTATPGRSELVDQNGTVIALSDISGLPTVETQEPEKKVGEAVGSDELFALNLISGVFQMYQVGYGMILNDALVVDMPGSVRVIFPLEGDSEILLGALRLIYTKLTTSYPGVYSQIDMRYKNPVLR